MRGTVGTTRRTSPPSASAAAGDLEHLTSRVRRASPSASGFTIQGGAMSSFKQVTVALSFVAALAGPALGQSDFARRRVVTPAERREVRRDGGEGRQDRRGIG